MALTATVTKETVVGNMKLLMGTYTNAGGSTSGTLALAVNAVYGLMVCSSATTARETSIAWASGTLTIYCNTSDTGGYFQVYCY